MRLGFEKTDMYKFENWIVLDSITDPILLDEQLCFLSKQSNRSSAVCQQLPGSKFEQRLDSPESASFCWPDNAKFIVETSDLAEINPSLVGKAILVVQQRIEWKHVLETKIDEICFKYSVPQSK